MDAVVDDGVGVVVVPVEADAADEVAVNEEVDDEGGCEDVEAIDEPVVFEEVDADEDEMEEPLDVVLGRAGGAEGVGPVAERSFTKEPGKRP